MGEESPVEPPEPVRQLAFGSHFVMPGASWYELAENDPEMQLMGPHPVIPDFVDPNWCLPRKSHRALPPPPSAAPFLNTQNAFHLLSELDEEVTPPPAPLRAVWTEADRRDPSPSLRGTGRPEAVEIECTPSASEEPPTPTPSSRTD